MTNVIKLSAVPSGKTIHDFGTLVVVSGLNIANLRDVAASRERHVIQHTNGSYYALPATLAGVLRDMKIGMAEQFGEKGRDIMLAQGTGMVWTKGRASETTKSAYISVACQGNTYERRVDYKELAFY